MFLIDIKTEQKLINDIISDFQKYNQESLIVKDKEYEFECRIRMRDVSSIIKAIENIDKEMKKMNIKSVESISTILILENGIRKITEKKQGIEKTYYQSKTNKMLRNGKDSYILDFLKFDLKFAIATEETKKEEMKNQVVHIIRKRNRKEYNIEEEGIILFITEVNEENKMTGIIQNKLEIEIEFLNIEKIKTIEKLLGTIKKITTIMFPNDGFITNTIYNNKLLEYNNYMNEVNKTIFKYNRSIDYLKSPEMIEYLENKPIAFKRNITKYFFKEDYSITNKLNGIKYNLYINGIKNNKNIFIFLLNAKKEQTKYIGKIENKELNNKDINYIIDGELIENDNNYIFNIFDVKVLNNEVCVNNIHKERFNNMIKDELLKWIINTSNNLNKCKIVFKNFLFSSTNISFTDRIRMIMKYINEQYGDKYKEMNDGIIFTPENQIYVQKNQPNSSSSIYKFKFDHTIDVFINEKEEIYVNYNFKNQDPKKITNIKIIDDIKKFQNKIVEISFESKIDNIYYFKIYKIRYDKPRSNSSKVYDDTIDAINDDITTPEKLLEIIYREYNNMIKTMVLNKVSLVVKDYVIADIGSGVGGDIYKYMNYVNDKKTKLILIEPDKDNINQGKIRLEKGGWENKNNEWKNKNMNIQIINAKAEETDKIINKENNNRADIVSMFFSLTFLFENNNMINSCINTIDNLCNVRNSYFIGTVSNGKKMKEILNKNNGKYQNEYLQINMIDNTHISIKLKHGSSLKDQIEPLTDLELLDKICEKKYIMKKLRMGFPPNKKIFNENENEMIQSNDYFIYRKKWNKINIKQFPTGEIKETYLPILNYYYDVKQLYYLLQHHVINKLELGGYYNLNTKLFYVNKNILNFDSKNNIPFVDNNESFINKFNYYILWHNHPINTTINNGFISLPDLITCIKRETYTIELIMLCGVIYVYTYKGKNRKNDIENITKWYETQTILPNEEKSNEKMKNIVELWWEEYKKSDIYIKNIKIYEKYDLHMKWACYMENKFTKSNNIFEELKRFGIIYKRVDSYKQLIYILNILQMESSLSFYLDKLTEVENYLENKSNNKFTHKKLLLEDKHTYILYDVHGNGDCAFETLDVTLKEVTRSNVIKKLNEVLTSGNNEESTYIKKLILIDVIDFFSNKFKVTNEIEKIIKQQWLSKDNAKDLDLYFYLYYVNNVLNNNTEFLTIVLSSDLPITGTLVATIYLFKLNVNCYVKNKDGMRLEKTFIFNKNNMNIINIMLMEERVHFVRLVEEYDIHTRFDCLMLENLIINESY